MYIRELRTFRERLTFIILFLFSINVYSFSSYWILFRFIANTAIGYFPYAVMVSILGLIGAKMYSSITKRFIGADRSKSMTTFIQLFCIIGSLCIGSITFLLTKSWQPIIMVSLIIWFGAWVAQLITYMIIEIVEEMEPNIVIKIVNK